MKLLLVFKTEQPSTIHSLIFQYTQDREPLGTNSCKKNKDAGNIRTFNMFRCSLFLRFDKNTFQSLTLMCLKVKLTGLVSLVLVVLGRVAEITVDIMVLIVSFDVLKKSGFSRFSIIL